MALNESSREAFKLQKKEQEAEVKHTEKKEKGSNTTHSDLASRNHHYCLDLR